MRLRIKMTTHKRLPLVSTVFSVLLLFLAFNVIPGLAQPRTAIGSPVFVASAPVPISAVSRKIHGAAGPFDIGLPFVGVDGAVGIEDRVGAVTGAHQMVVTFPSAVTVGGVAVTTGTGSATFSVSGNVVTINLTGVANAQRIGVTLMNVSSGANSGNVLIPMGVLLGDTTGNSRVNSSDVSQVKVGASAGTVNALTFRQDVNTSGTVSAQDVALVKPVSGSFLPGQTGGAQTGVVTGSLTQTGTGASTFNISSNQQFQLTVTVSTNFVSSGVTYFLRTSNNGSGFFQVIARDTTLNPYPDPTTSDSRAFGGSAGLLNPVNYFDLGETNNGSETPAGTYVIANLTFNTLNAPVGQYTIFIDRGIVTDRTGGDFEDSAFTALATINVTSSFPALIVTTVDDHNDGSCDAADCTLREAITGANTLGGREIAFASGVTGTIQLTSPLPNITSHLRLQGPGADLLTVRRNTGGAYRIFTIKPNTFVSISGLTISDGNISGAAFPDNSGGGILNEESTLTLSNCALSGNTASLHGGAILNLRGTLTLTSCTLNQNSASGSGGAILSAAYNGTTIANLTNCTVSQNTAGQYGGAIYNDGTSSGNAALTLTNCTLNQNNASIGAGGIYNDGLNPGSSGIATLRLRNTILRAGTGVNLVNDGGTITSDGRNLSSDAAGGPAGSAPGGFLNNAGDIRNTDPQLAALANNGGPTQTHALLSTSPAINAGDDTLAPSRDQRSYVRSGVSDIGAFEFGGTLAPLSVLSRKTHGAGGPTYDINLPLTGTAGVECRSGGASNVHQVIMTFPFPVAVASASVTPDPNVPGATGSVSGYSVSGSQVTVNLTGVSNAQTIVITLTNVSDGTNTTPSVTTRMGILLGDTTGNGSVNASDVSLTKLKSGQSVDATSFRTDVTVSNSINATDVSTVKLKTGTALP